MELKNLVGEHKLDAVDFDTIRLKEQYGDALEACQCMRFRLDGVLYSAVEDPNDGYRSAMRELVVADADAVIKNTFAPVGVLGILIEKSRDGWSNADILELRSIKTGALILEVGTDATDDYYPSFVAAFHPEAIPA